MVTVTKPIPCYRSREGLVSVCLASGNQRRSCYPALDGDLPDFACSFFTCLQAPNLYPGQDGVETGSSSCCSLVSASPRQTPPARCPTPGRLSTTVGVERCRSLWTWHSISADRACCDPLHFPLQPLACHALPPTSRGTTACVGPGNNRFSWTLVCSSLLVGSRLSSKQLRRIARCLLLRAGSRDQKLPAGREYTSWAPRVFCCRQRAEDVGASSGRSRPGG